MTEATDTPRESSRRTSRALRPRRYLTARAGWWLALGAAPALLAPGRLPWLVAGAWLVGWLGVVGRDISLSVPPEALEVSRELPVKLSIGVANPVVLSVRNRAARVARLRVRETPPSGFVGERRAALLVPSFDACGIDLSFTPPARGCWRFGRPGVRSLGPLGLGGWQFAPDIAEDVRVYPDITAVRSYALLARKGSLLEMGVRQARLAGAGMEFESLREYRPGDDYRDIDWKATARRGDPVVRQFEVERSQTIVIALDAGRLMTPAAGGLSKLDRAANAALLLAYLAVANGDLVGLVVFGRDVEAFLPPRKGHRQFLAILEALYAVEARVEEPDYERALRFLAAKLTKRSLVVLFTDVLGTEPSRRLLRVLSSITAKHLPLVLTQRDRAIEARARAAARTESDAFAAAVAEDILRDKAAALGVLSAAGALALDVDPNELSVAAVNRYLEIKARGRL